MEDVAIKLSNVSKYYKLYSSPKDRLKEGLHPFGKKYHEEFCALRNIDLEVKKGEVLGILGKNGSGKSTLLKLIAGVLGASQGVLHVKGKVSALLELGAGFNPDFTGLENIYFYGMVLGLTKGQIDQRLDEIVAFADIGKFLDQPIKTYSSGMKSRLGFAIAVNVDPEILILDEVLSVGDAFFRKKCFAKMESFFNSGKTIIFVSHDAQSIVQLCNKAILLNEGELVAIGKPREVVDIYNKSIGLDGRTATVKEENPQDKKEITSAFKVESQTISNSSVKTSKYIVFDARKKAQEILKCGENYSFSFVVNSEVSEHNLRIAFVIKNEKGISLGGAKIVDLDILPAGEEVLVEKRFYCNFKPGYYFVTVTVTSRESGQREILHRVVDALVFKIESWPEDGYWGLTYLAPYTTANQIVEKC